uniref:Reverse transcriptase domain-containing protein n=1 Tax=Tanacetum cinerariifolium TaxID=118510 RepID=A0A699GLV1_TANCI|nr:reverse transcriptase domain-containing protein [Tanacetum cinerariifolium]
MPNNVKTYDGTRDLEDHVKIFQAAAQVERWAMPTWCHMFNSTIIGTIIGADRVWFDELLPESIDSCKNLKAAFLAYFMQQKNYVKDPIEFHNIKQKDGETIEDFMERFKVETGRIKGGPECMWISGFMHGVNNPELTKRLNEHVPKTMEEMMITTAFIRGEAAAASKKKSHTSWRTHDQSKRQTSEKREITFPPLTTSSGAEGPLVIEAEIGGHMIHRMYVDGGSSMEILYEHCFNRLHPEALGNNRRRRSFYKSMDEFHDFDGGIVTIRSTILIPAECATVITSSTVPKEVGAHPENFKVALHQNFPDQEVAIEGTLSAKGRTKLCSLLKENLDLFAWQPSDMTGVPQSGAEHRLNIREGYSPVRQNKRGQPPERTKAMKQRNRLETQIPLRLPFQVFLDAYKGYHQIQLAELDEEKMAFHIGQAVYCYTKIPFGLKNAGATYQRLVDNVFHNQISQNIEVYVDDLFVKSHTEAEMLRDIGETFRTLRKINMKLNPKKCMFRAVEEMFLGYMVTLEGIRPCPDKTSAVLQLPSPRTIKEVQSLNGKLASLNRFLSKSAEKSLPLFKTLKKCIKKSDFHWTSEAEQAFKQLKQHLSELPLLVAPKPKEELIVYLSASYGAISAVFMTERGAVQTPVYFVSRALQGPELNYTPMEKQVMSLVFAAKRLRRTTAKMKRHAGRAQYHVPANDVGKRTVLAYFLAEVPDKSPPAASVVETQQEQWTLFTDGSLSSNNEAEYEALIAGLRIAAPMGVQNVHVSVDFKLVANQVLGTYVTKEENMIKYLEKVKSLVSGFTNFSISQVPRSKNRKADALSKNASTSFAHLSKQVLVEILKEKFIQEKEVTTVVEEDGPTWMTPIMKRSFLAMWLRCIGPLKAEYVIKEIHEGSCSMHAGPRSMVAKAIRLGYYWPTMHRDMRDMIHTCNDFQIHRPVTRNPQQPLNPITAPWPFYKWGIDIADPFPEGPVDVVYNDEKLRLNLDLLEERRERAAISEAKAKLKMTKYYNVRVRGVTFRPGDFVYRSNDTSHAVDGGKL